MACSEGPGEEEADPMKEGKITARFIYGHGVNVPALIVKPDPRACRSAIRQREQTDAVGLGQ